MNFSNEYVEITKTQIESTIRKRWNKTNYSSYWRMIWREDRSKDVFRQTNFDFYYQKQFSFSFEEYHKDKFVMIWKHHFNDVFEKHKKKYQKISINKNIHKSQKLI